MSKSLHFQFKNYEDQSDPVEPFRLKTTPWLELKLLLEMLKFKTANTLLPYPFHVN